MWNATEFFRTLTEHNKLARQYNFRFCTVTDLDTFEQALHTMQNTANFVCLSETEAGYTDINNSPHTRRVKTVYFAMRHALDDMDARRRCVGVMNELFRQFASKIILERTRLENNRIYLDPRISFQEIDQYFFSGCACCYFQIATDTYTDLRYNPEEWNE